MCPESSDQVTIPTKRTKYYSHQSLYSFTPSKFQTIEARFVVLSNVELGLALDVGKEGPVDMVGIETPGTIEDELEGEVDVGEGAWLLEDAELAGLCLVPPIPPPMAAAAMMMAMPIAARIQSRCLRVPRSLPPSAVPLSLARLLGVPGETSKIAG